MRAFRLLFTGLVALLLNSAYLWAFADPTLGYFAQVALHPLLGMALSIGGRVAHHDAALER